MAAGCRFTKPGAVGKCRPVAAVIGLIALCLVLSHGPVAHAEPSPTPAAVAAPLKIGLGVSLSGAESANGQQILIALQLWRDDVNAKGGLLGRPIELVSYDDQSNPAVVPGIYYKLITEDKVDLLLGPCGRNTAAAAMRVLMNFNKLTIGILGVGVNRVFSYWRYFTMAPFGSAAAKAFSKGFFDLAAAQTPRPKTVAILGGDAKFIAALAASARDDASEDDFNLIYDERYAPPTADLMPLMRMLKDANPDVVFVAADQSQTARIVRATREIALAPKMLGGSLSGLLNTPIKTELGPLLDGMVTAQSFVPAHSLSFPGLADLMKRYRAAATAQHADPLGFSYAPFGYAAGQVLAQAVEATHGIDPDQLAQYIHGHRLPTVVGEIEYDGDGEWTKARPLFTQFQNVANDNFEQFADEKVQPIVWPPQFRTADVVYPYSAATKK